VGEQGYVHNLYVEVLCELGLPMFVLLVLLFWRTGSASLALFRRYGDRPAERSAVSILLAMCVYQALLAAKEGNLWSSWNLFTFMLLITRIETRARVLGEDQPDVAEDEMTEEAHEEEIEERERVEQPA
jgi:O-antigen ligase